MKSHPSILWKKNRHGETETIITHDFILQLCVPIFDLVKFSIKFVAAPILIMYFWSYFNLGNSTYLLAVISAMFTTK